jgi:cellulose synthase/poly-beta-1,6-N-acetylglucosamine synthase-like glycosyltransferase
MQTVWFVYLLYLGISLLLSGIAWTNLVWMVSAWRTPGSLADSGLPRADLESTLSFSLIVPARHEEAVLEATLSRLVKSDHPDFEVLVVVGSDDPGTRQVADGVAGRHPELVKVVLDDSWPKSKPKALNTALPYCTGAITGVFDAEDVVHPALLARVDQCFQRTNALATVAAPAARARRLHPGDAVPDGGRVADDPGRDRNRGRR